MNKLSAIILAAALALPAHAADYLDRSGWSWSASSILPDGNDYDVPGLEGICDDDEETCWHSNYKADSSSPERRVPFWILIDRGYDNSEMTGISYLPRYGENIKTCVTSYAVYFFDKNPGNVPSDTWDNILYTLGDPDEQGYVEPDFSERIIGFSKSHSSRYVLFVIINTQGGSSAACAELNIFGNGGTPGPVTPPVDKTYNSIRIEPVSGASHRIAIDGDNLTLTMNGTAVRLGNSAIMVEYPMAEVKQFVPEVYQWPAETLYEGDKPDINSLIPSGITLSSTALSLTVGATAQLSATVTPETAVYDAIGWFSSRRTVATIDENGLITALAPGTSTITARVGEGDAAVSATCKLTVVEPEPEPVIEPSAIILSTNAVALLVDETVQLTATVEPADAVYDAIVWSSNNAAVASVDEQGLVTALTAGTAEISASAGEVSALCTITVTEPQKEPDPIEPDPAEDGISQTALPTITLSRQGDLLLVKGLRPASTVLLHNMQGVQLLNVDADADGVAALPVGALSRGSYILSTSGVTFKVIF